jgi:hypothetical protein
MRVHVSECSFEIDDGWTDESSYLYVDDAIHVATGRYAARTSWPRKLDEALERFALAAPGYELLERVRSDRPIPGTERVAHRVGGGYPVFEVSLFLPIRDEVWMFRVSGPHHESERCRAALDAFVASYQPTEEP